MTAAKKMTTQDYFDVYQFNPKTTTTRVSEKKAFDNGDELREIVKMHCSGNDEAMKVIGGFTKLNYLDLGECVDVSDAGFEELRDCKLLKYLGCWETKLSDSGLESLAGIGLDAIDLRSTDITDAAGDTLAKMTSLTSIEASGTKVTDEFLGKISTLPTLQKLTLANTGVTS